MLVSHVCDTRCDERRDPDAILRQINAAEALKAGETSGRDHLKIFFGYAAGVGKTYAMLKEAHEEKTRGRDVSVGYIEPHTRRDTCSS